MAARPVKGGSDVSSPSTGGGGESTPWGERQRHQQVCVGLG